MKGAFSQVSNINRLSLKKQQYNNLLLGLPIDFYDGRHDPNHTPWILYFVETMANAASELQAKARLLYKAGAPEVPQEERLPRTSQQLLTRLLARVLDGAENPFVINSSDIDSWFSVSERTAREWLKQWTEEGFVNPVATASGERVRNYALAPEWVDTCFQMTTSSEIV